ncbi:type 2 lantipeptide synthetase LanM [Streptacidiphilus sp. 4-A2]|nr:type 2 lantipeptide synthetase LanM [Streptacidiphilus sp. 4-A2]
MDLSALGGDPGAPLPDPVTGWSAPATDEMQLIRTTGAFRRADNRPRLNGADADPTVHTEALLAGFRAAYDAIAAGRDQLAGLLAGFATDETRVLLRHTWQYTTLLDESTHPDLLRDAADRDRLLDVLWRDSAGDPLLRALVDTELADLRAGDVPLITARPADRSLRLGRRTVADAVAESGHDWARRRLAAMGRTDRYDQEWVIRAALAVRKGEREHRPGALPPGPVSAIVPDQERLLAAACGIADQILAGAQDDGRHVNWLGLEPLEGDLHWALLPQGAGLPHGYCGTALFLAQLAGLTGVERYAAVARRALTPIPALLSALGEQPAELPFIGAGFSGLGGIAYALALLAGLLDDPDLSSWAATAVGLAATAAGTGADPGVLHGDAGCLAALLAVHRTTGLQAAWDTARVSARRLLARPVDDLSTGGFTDGAPGIGWALLRFADAGGGPDYAEAGLDRLRAAALHHPPDQVRDSRAGWCTGASGLALAVADRAAGDADPRLAALLDAVTTASTRHGVTADHSLCHGETGLLELLLAATAAGRAAPGAALPRAGALLAALDRFGPRCGTPTR